MKFLNAESAVRAVVRGAGAAVMERWALGLRAAAGKGLTTVAASACAVVVSVMIGCAAALAVAGRAALVAAPDAPEADLAAGALGAAALADLAGVVSGALPVLLPEGFAALGAGGFVEALFPGAFGVALFAEVFAAEALLATGFVAAPLVATFAEAGALGFGDLLAAADFGDLAGDFTALLVVVLAFALGAALAVVPRLFPDDAAMAGLWLVWIREPQ